MNFFACRIIARQGEHGAVVRACLVQGIYQDHQLLVRCHLKLLRKQAAVRSAPRLSSAQVSLAAFCKDTVGLEVKHASMHLNIRMC